MTICPSLPFHLWKLCIKLDYRQIYLGAVIVRLLLIFNKRKAPVHAEASSVLSVFHSGTSTDSVDLGFVWVQLTPRWQQSLFLSHRLPSVHQMYELLFFSAARYIQTQYRNAHIPSSPLIGFVALLYVNS